MRYAAVAVLIVGCNGGAGSPPAAGRYAIDAYSTAGGVDIPCDSIGTPFMSQAHAFELRLADGALMLRTCVSATDCDSFTPGEYPIVGGPFISDSFTTFNAVPDAIEGPPNPPPPTSCMLTGIRIDLADSGSTTTIHEQIRDQPHTALADCDLAHALAPTTCTGTVTFTGHLVQAAPRVDTVVPAMLSASACTSTSIELDGDHFLPNAILAAAAPTGLCADGSYAFGLDGSPGYCPIAVDSVTPTKITAHFTQCPAAGPTKLVVINGDGTYNAMGRPLTFGQLVFIDTFAID